MLALVLAFCSCTNAASVSKLPDVRLPTLGGPLGPSLSKCSTEKCLTVIVAPWCGVCHSVRPDVVLLRRYLDTTGISSRVVVGLDNLEKIKSFAAEFGSDSLLDVEGVVPVRGVPLFLVTNRQGAILKRVDGFPRGAASMKDLAAFFGLP